MLMFQLALRLGRTVGELVSTLSAEEFEYWKAFTVLEPIGVMREDALFANLCLTLANSQRYSFKDDLKLGDFVVFKKDRVEPEPDQEQVMRNIKALFGALSAKSKA